MYLTSQIPIVIGETTGWTGIYEDRDNHGTVVASIISGYPAAVGPRKEQTDISTASGTPRRRGW